MLAYIRKRNTANMCEIYRLKMQTLFWEIENHISKTLIIDRFEENIDGVSEADPIIQV